MLYAAHKVLIGLVCNRTLYHNPWGQSWMMLQNTCLQEPLPHNTFRCGFIHHGAVNWSGIHLKIRCYDSFTHWATADTRACRVNDSQTSGQLARMHCCCKQRLTVHVDSQCTTHLNFWSKVCDVALQSTIAMHMSVFLLFVCQGCWDPLTLVSSILLYPLMPYPHHYGHIPSNRITNFPEVKPTFVQFNNSLSVIGQKLVVWLPFSSVRHTSSLMVQKMRVNTS